GGDVPLRKAEYGVLSLPTMIGEDPYIYIYQKVTGFSRRFLFTLMVMFFLVSICFIHIWFDG
ncbi:hypothetical protein ACP6DS_28745, partial [Klebsiella pneumoniae subsp. pneumoniae]|uniref:hypothetical protein n=1 Tax=Klebsiella pneumoniae TaxID=573 RepID=UPI003CEB6178